MSDKKSKSKPEARKKPLTELELHVQRLCGCSVKVNPNFCVYQPFLDGWDFTPDVGNGQKRGEVFTPRFVVDKMITMGSYSHDSIEPSHKRAGIFPDKAVYEYDYSGSTETIRKIIGQRIFEPAVGTANFAATILWHKLQYANMITSNSKQESDEDNDDIGKEEAFHATQPKTPAQLLRYQVYTLVALASIYINDIDAGNLQTSKFRFLRNTTINNEENIEFWIKHIKESMDKEPDSDWVKNAIEESLKTAEANWGVFDDDKGVLDVLYKEHTKQKPPTWLSNLWKIIMDENAKLFNGIVIDDTNEENFVVAGYKNVVWNFWWFNYDKETINVAKRKMPLYRQILDGKLLELNGKADLIYGKGSFEGAPEDVLFIIEGEFTHKFASEEDEKEYKTLKREIAKIETELKTVKPYGEVEYLEYKIEQN